MLTQLEKETVIFALKVRTTSLESYIDTYMINSVIEDARLKAAKEELESLKAAKMKLEIVD